MRIGPRESARAPISAHDPMGYARWHGYAPCPDVVPGGFSVDPITVPRFAAGLDCSGGPRRQSLWHPPSTCPQCGKRIRARDNVPIFGWLWLRGKCRDCHLPISARYPLVEATTAAVFALIYWRDVVAVPVELPESQRWFWFAWHTSLVCCR